MHSYEILSTHYLILCLRRRYVQRSKIVGDIINIFVQNRFSQNRTSKNWKELSVALELYEKFFVSNMFLSEVRHRYESTSNRQLFCGNYNIYDLILRNLILRVWCVMNVQWLGCISKCNKFIYFNLKLHHWIIYKFWRHFKRVLLV